VFFLVLELGCFVGREGVLGLCGPLGSHSMGSGLCLVVFGVLWWWGGDAM
jgi:hypothetical protein